MEAVYSYDWQWRIQTALPPPTKTAGSNTGNWVNAASLYFSYTHNGGTDVSAVFRAMVKGDLIKYEHKTDLNIWALFTLQTKPIDYPAGSHFNIPVTLNEIHGSSADNTVYRVTLAQAPVTPPDTTVIGDPVMLALAHGYGDNTADTIVCVTADKKMWIRRATRDHRWVEVSNKKSTTEPSPQMPYVESSKPI